MATVGVYDKQNRQLQHEHRNTKGWVVLYPLWHCTVCGAEWCVWCKGQKGCECGPLAA